MIAFLLSRWGAYALVALLVAASYGAAYWKGREAGWERRERVAMAEAARAEKAAQMLAKRRADASERVVVKFRDRVQIVEQEAKEVIREVEKLVPVDACDLPGGWRVLHDAAASGRFPDAAGRAAAAPIDAQAAARAVAQNYAGCRADQERLIALQDWVTKQQEVR